MLHANIDASHAPEPHLTLRVDMMDDTTLQVLTRGLLTNVPGRFWGNLCR